MDIVAGNKIIVELKCVDKILPVHEAQLLTYLKLTNLQVGLILNFYVPVMKDGIKRLVS
jgi:GxxExxY protein